MAAGDRLETYSSAVYHKSRFLRLLILLTSSTIAVWFLYVLSDMSLLGRYEQINWPTVACHTSTTVQVAPFGQGLGLGESGFQKSEQGEPYCIWCEILESVSLLVSGSCVITHPRALSASSSLRFLAM